MPGPLSPSMDAAGARRPAGPAHRHHPLSNILLPRSDTMQSLFLSDVELGKKDDDHNWPSKGGHGHGHGHGHRAPASFWAAARGPQRRLLKRVLFFVCGLVVVYVFIKNMPEKGGLRENRRPVYYHRGGEQVLAHGRAPAPGTQAGRAAAEAAAKLAAEAEAADGYVDPGSAEGTLKTTYTYNGPLRSDRLMSTLRTISNTRGSFATNKNVLFAAASLHSITTLLPAACEMGTERRNYVHFAVMGRSDVDLDELQQMNGIDESCNIIFHDARPDYSTISTEERMEKNMERSLKQIDVYMHPQAIIVDSAVEEPFLLDALRTFDKSNAAELIELPENGAQRVGWFTKLDSTSLASWNKITVDILIHAYPGASGSLIRLLKSLSHADFGTGSVPHVTIELPQTIDPPTEEFLASFKWPPVDDKEVYHEQQLSLRHRIPKHGISEEDSSVRFLESFWPVHPQHSHVLVLSPQTELSRDFFHYVKYALLEYRYSSAAKIGALDQQLFGISLELPTTALDGATKLALPAAASADDGAAPFLWQAPNSNAMVFLGERWRELHGFVAQLLEKEPAAAAAAEAPAAPAAPAKLVSKKYPSWLEYALQLCQARGYWTLYPSQALAGTLATVHNELYRPPEEYEKEMEGAAVETNAADQDDEVRLRSDASLMDVLPRVGSLSPVAELPLLTWDGTTTTLKALTAQAAAFAQTFRRSIGGCSAAELETLPVETLFCGPSV